MRLGFESKWLRLQLEVGREPKAPEFVYNGGGDFQESPSHDPDQWNYSESYDMRFGFRGRDG